MKNTIQTFSYLAGTLLLLASCKGKAPEQPMTPQCP